MTDITPAPIAIRVTGLGSLVRALGRVAANTRVQVSVAGVLSDPGTLHAYRGDGAALSIRPDGEPITAKEFKAVLKSALGQTFNGYLGGKFKMNDRSAVMVSRYRHEDGNRVVSVVRRGEVIVIVTEAVTD
jgi:hypothetical protein